MDMEEGWDGGGKTYTQFRTMYAVFVELYGTVFCQRGGKRRAGREEEKRTKEPEPYVTLCRGQWSAFVRQMCAWDPKSGDDKSDVCRRIGMRIRGNKEGT